MMNQRLKSHRNRPRKVPKQRTVGCGGQTIRHAEGIQQIWKSTPHVASKYAWEDRLPGDNE
jgi:hypothetical protein